MKSTKAVTANIMIVDDTPINLRLLDRLLRDEGYKVFAFPLAEMAVRAARQNPPDLILLDINMPGMDGYEACQNLKADPGLQHIPIIFISAFGEPMDKVRAFNIGGVDYVNKPFEISEVLARVKTHLQIHQMRRKLESYNHYLEERVSEQVKEIADSQLATILALAKLAESRDDNTGQHLERVQSFSRILAERLAELGTYPEVLGSGFAENIYFACSLHDIGKVGISDQVLLKPGKLTRQEFEIMKTHARIGGDTLKSVHEKYPNNNFIKMGIDIARWHHERWDGHGYPDGLAQEMIPLSARIMSVVDVYDALRSERPYKEGFSHQKACDIIAAGSGAQFDPAIVAAFIDVNKEFERVFEMYSGTINDTARAE